MSISSDEVNFLIYRYLLENGFSHSAFTFAYESLVIKSSMAQTEIPPGALITFLQKGLEYIAVEEHINEDGSIQEFENNYSLLSPLICEAIAVKEDRRMRRVIPAAASNASSTFTVSDSKSGTTYDASSSVDASGAITVDETSTSAVVELTSSVISSTAQLMVGENEQCRYLRLLGHRGEIFMCTWSPSTNVLATGSADGMCRLWNLVDEGAGSSGSSGDVVPITVAVLPHCVSEGQKFRDVTSISWSPDGQWLATGCYDGSIRVWSSAGKLSMLLREHTGPVFSLKWNKAGTLLLSGSYDQRAIVWSPHTGVIVQAYVVHSAPVLDVDWRAGGLGDVFASCSSDQTIQICQVTSNGHNVPSSSIGSGVAVGGAAATAAVSSSSTSSSFPLTTSSLCTLRGHTDEINAIAWSPGAASTALLASCSDDSTAKIWGYRSDDSLNMELKNDLRGHTKVIFTLRWTLTGPDSNNPHLPLRLCTASFDGTVKIWSDSGELLLDLCQQVQPVYSLSPSPDGLYIATGSLGGNVSLWSASSGELKQEIQGSGDTFDISWSKDGRQFSSCFSSGQVYVIQVPDASNDSKDEDAGPMTIA